MPVKRGYPPLGPLVGPTVLRRPHFRPGAPSTVDCLRAEILLDSPAALWIFDIGAGSVMDYANGLILTQNGTMSYGVAGPLVGSTAMSTSNNLANFMDTPSVTALDLFDPNPFWLEVGYARTGDAAGVDEVLFAKADPTHNFGYGLQIDDAVDKLQLARVGGARLCNTVASVPADSIYRQYFVNRNNSGAGNTKMYVNGDEGHTDLGGIGNTIDTTTGHLTVFASDEVGGRKGPLLGAIAYLAMGAGNLAQSRIVAHRLAWNQPCTYTLATVAQRGGLWQDEETDRIAVA